MENKTESRNAWVIAITVWIAIIVGLAFVASARLSVILLAFTCAGAALLRALTGGAILPPIRSRWFDVLCYVGLALALVIFTPWASAAPVL